MAWTNSGRAVAIMETVIAGSVRLRCAPSTQGQVIAGASAFADTSARQGVMEGFGRAFQIGGADLQDRTELGMAWANRNGVVEVARLRAGVLFGAVAIMEMVSPKQGGDHPRRDNPRGMRQTLTT